MKFVILGCGTSAGVPRIGNDWGDCDPANPKNKRSRASILVENNAGRRILIDTTPDMRMQMLNNDIGHIDAVIWTHDHADHCHGIDDLRGFYHRSRQPVKGYGREYTVANLTNRFNYVFSGNKGYPSTVELYNLRDRDRIADISVTCTDQPHGPVYSTGLRFDSNGKSLAYATDFSEITDDMIKLYQNCDVLIVDCLRKEPHPTHAHLELSKELADHCNAKHTVLTHMDKSMDYNDLCDILPNHIEAAYDGYMGVI